jgi:hypothetical protein
LRRTSLLERNSSVERREEEEEEEEFFNHYFKKTDLLRHARPCRVTPQVCHHQRGKPEGLPFAHGGCGGGGGRGGGESLIERS